MSSGPQVSCGESSRGLAKSSGLGVNSCVLDQFRESRTSYGRGCSDPLSRSGEMFTLGGSLFGRGGRGRRVAVVVVNMVVVISSAFVGFLPAPHYDPDGQIWSAESCNV